VGARDGGDPVTEEHPSIIWAREFIDLVVTVTRGQRVDKRYYTPKQWEAIEKLTSTLATLRAFAGDRPKQPGTQVPPKFHQRVYRLLADGIPRSRADIERAFGRAPKDRATGRALETLREHGVVVCDNGFYRLAVQSDQEPGAVTSSPDPDVILRLWRNRVLDAGTRGP
jgi:ATP phosphoribosyltransferase regulatory subunit HisZ